MGPKIRAAMAALLASAALGAGLRGAAAEPVTLHFWAAWDSGQPETVEARKQIALFEHDHPDIKIDVQTIAFQALHDKLVTSISGGDAPDVSWGLVEWLGELNGMGALEDLTSRVAAWPDRSAIFPQALAALSVDGHVMALPHYLGLRALLYHKSLLKAAGVAAPPATWGDLLAASAKIKAATGKPGFGIAATGVRCPQELLTFLAQNDVTLADKTPDGKYRNTWSERPDVMKRATEVFDFYHDLARQGAIAPDAKAWGWEEEDTNFALGRYAMVVDGAWMRGRVAQNPDTMGDIGVAPPPYKLKPATFFEVNPFFVFKGKHPDAAWEFASFMLGHGFQAAVHPDSSPRRDVVGDATWGKGFSDLTPTGVSYPPVALGALTRAMEEAVGRVMLKNEGSAEVAAWLAKSINRALKQSGELGAE